MDETLRVNGTAKLRDDAVLLSQFPLERRPPRIVVEIDVEEAFLHCAKALMRSKLWDSDNRIERTAFPSLGQMIKDQSGLPGPAETQEEAVLRYKIEL